MTDAYSIEPIRLPQDQDDPAWPGYAAWVELHNLVSAHVLGSDVAALVAVEVLPGLLDDKHQAKTLYVARLNDQIVAKGACFWSVETESDVMWIDGAVHPDFRNRGIGTALFDRLEQDAAAQGKSVFQGGATHTTDGEERISPPTGFGNVPADDPGVRFLRKRGYGLEQVMRMSSLPLPVDPKVLAAKRADAEAKAGPDYRVHTWTTPSPEEWLADLGHIFERMATDAPSGNLEIDEERWDADRVRESEARSISVGRTRLNAVVEHIPSGKLVAFNGLTWSADFTQPVNQGITLVLKEHRGKRLGMLTKVANIQRLAELRPDATQIITDNAEENRPMLDVNEAVGFVPIGYIGAWKKTTAS